MDAQLILSMGREQNTLEPVIIILHYRITAETKIVLESAGPVLEIGNRNNDKILKHLSINNKL